MSEHTDKNNTNDQLESDQLEIGIDFKRVKEIVLKYNILLLVLIPIFVSIFLRVGPAYLPSMDTYAESNMESYVSNLLQQEVLQQYPNLPEANRNNIVSERLQQAMQDGQVVIQGQTLDINTAIKENADYLRSRFQDENGHTYLLAIDPYHYYRLAENYLDHGFDRDVEVEGGYVDSHTQGGMPIEERGFITSRINVFHVFFEAYFYKIVSIFDPDITLMRTSFFVPVIFAALATIPAFFIGRRFAGNTAGLLSGLIIAIHPSFLTRTVAGFTDTDAYNVFFPLLIMWVFFEAFYAKKSKNAYLLIGLAGLFTGLFSFAWAGWWYTFDFLIFVLIAYLVYLGLTYLLHKNNKEKLFSAGLLTAIFLISTGLFTAIFSTFSNFTSALFQPFHFTQIKDVGLKLWPNVLTTVAEMNPSNLSSTMSQISLSTISLSGVQVTFLASFFFAMLGIIFILLKDKKVKENNLFLFGGSLIWYILLMLVIDKMSGIIFVLFALVPLVYAFYKTTEHMPLFFISCFAWFAIILKFRAFFDDKVMLFLVLLMLPTAIAIVYSIVKKQHIDIRAAVLLLVWFAGTLYASTKGIRFILLLVPAFAITLGFSLTIIKDIVAKLVAKIIGYEKWLKILFTCMVFLLLIPPFMHSLGISKQQAPSMNDAWYATLTKIKEESQEDAIITSWWDFGHWFKAIADRTVTFDGSSQDSPMAHWVGRALQTSNEKEAVGILRMLDCGSIMAFDNLYELNNQDFMMTIAQIKEIILLDKDEASSYLLEQGIIEENLESVLQYSHCDPPEGYFITSDDMIGKGGVWSHFGLWDFEKAYLVNLVSIGDKEEAISFMESSWEYTTDQANEEYNNIVALGSGADANNWISPWPQYYGTGSNCVMQEGHIVCDNGIVVNQQNWTATLYVEQGTAPVASLVYVDEDGDFQEKILSDDPDGVGISVGLIPTENGYNGILIDYKLATSMFQRLFFYKGHQLSCFKPFDAQKQVTGGDIYVWKIDWDCAEENNIYEIKIVEEVVVEDEEDIEDEDDATEENVGEEIDIDEDELIDEDAEDELSEEETDDESLVEE
jgi:dolichyl-phosphooligosaccharide-protein glycotransferase